MFQSEVKDAFVVVDTLAVSYDEKESELVTKIQENEDLMLKMAQLEVSGLHNSLRPMFGRADNNQNAVTIHPPISDFFVGFNFSEQVV